MNLETDKSHCEKRALVHCEQKKLKGFKPNVQWQDTRSPGVSQEVEGGTDKVQTTPCLCLHLALSAAIYENSFSDKFASVLAVVLCFCASVCLKVF